MAIRKFAEVSRDSGAARVENMHKTIKHLDSVRVVDLNGSILADMHPDIVERYRLCVGMEDVWTSGDIRMRRDMHGSATILCPRIRTGL